MIANVVDLSGHTIRGRSGASYKLVEKKGQGGQGFVYSEETGKYIIKFYFPTDNEIIKRDTIKRLQFIMNVEKPRNFVEIIDLIDEPYLGYVMERVTEEYKPLNRYLIPQENFSEWYNQDKGLRGRLFIGYIIAKAFGELSKQNLSYCDISGNNIYVSIGQKASVKMIDIDNIYIAGKGIPTVLGTPRYIAPEIIKREKNPDVLSDNYSLAVILYELLRVGHPYISDQVLDGSPEDEEKAYSGEGTYVTDENSTYMLPSEFVFTQRLLELFRQCFVDGKYNRVQRPSPREFELALLDASNKLIKCESCGAWHYPRKDMVTGQFAPCPWCDSPSKPKARLNFYDQLFTENSLDEARFRRELRTAVNSYILRENENNIIKNMYICNIGTNDSMVPSENHVCIANDKRGYFVYNRYNKDGIIVRSATDRRFYQVSNNQARQLTNGDEIYFWGKTSATTTLNINSETYHYVRLAVFMEEKK